MQIKLGCCGFPVAKDKYFKHFEVVEIQQTFYQPPKLETAIKWRQTAPSGFDFTLKAWQLITHPASSPTYRKLKQNIPEKRIKNYGFFKPTDEVFSAWETTCEIARALKAKIIIFQCPASFKATCENKGNLKKFFSSIKRESFYLAWEPRGNWEEHQIRNLCQDLDLIHCVDPFKNKPVFGKIAYFRLHGKGSYRYKYSDEDLKSLLKKINKETTYIMFNNVYMFGDALRFLEFIKK